MKNSQYPERNLVFLQGLLNVSTLRKRYALQAKPSILIKTILVILEPRIDYILS